MTIFPKFDLEALRISDAALRPEGAGYDTMSSNLAALYDRSARDLTLNHIRQLGMGDPANPRPIEVALLPRIVDALSVVYRTPATRRLSVAGAELPDDDPRQVALEDITRAMLYDAAWWEIDTRRNLHRQVIVSFVESAAHAAAGVAPVQMRIWAPHQFRRRPGAAADELAGDELVAFCLEDGDGLTRPGRWEVWAHEDSGTWTAWWVDGRGALLSDQPYGPEGRSPFGPVLPALLVYDALPNGRAYLALNTDRVAFALNTNALVSDLAYLVKQEAHSAPAIITDDPKGIPTATGPGRVMVLPGGSQVATLQRSPKIQECLGQLDLTLRLWAISEGLPADTFLEAAGGPATGAALRVRQRDLEARRERQAPLAYGDEARAYRALAAVWNSVVGREVLPPAATLRLSIGRAWQPVDPLELQRVAFADLSVGAMSLPDYVQDRFGDSRSDAIARLERVRTDRERYPAPGQNPAAAVDASAARLPLGQDAYEKREGEFNPDLASSTEEASLVAAARRGN